ncbi:MAG: sugar ABC transporter ATP-binding protein [Christensenellaceae bacterium]
MSDIGTEFVRMIDICKEFPGVKALQHVNLSVKRGEVHALVGENGAGKSTLIKVLMGVHPKTSGEVYVDNKEVEVTSPLDAQKLGLAAVYQDVTLASHLSVAENFFLGKIPKTKLGFVNWAYMNKTAQKTLDELNIKVDAKEIINNLSVANQEMVVIAKEYFENSKLLIFDEPTALLANEEVKELFGIIENLKKRGTAIIYISHRLEEIFEICDVITVLKDGQTVATLNVNETNEEELVAKMVGRSIEDMYSIKHHVTNDVVLEVKGLSSKGKFDNVDLTLHKGEVLGIFGLVGSGRTEIVRAIYGADPYDTGEIIVNGEKVNITSPPGAIGKGIGFLPEDRKQQGLTTATSITQNINLASYDSISKLGFINVKKEKKRAQEFTDALRIVTPGIYQKVINLSGGNQQKVVIAKWLCRNSKIFIFDEPTVGIDVGAKSEIYHLLESLLEEQNAVIMISSYLPEIMGIADKIMVIHEGKVTGIVSREEYSDESLLRMASGIE